MSKKLVLNDNQLISSLKDGDERAFYKIYQIYKDILYNYCLILTKNKEIVPDIVQSVFISIWLNHKKIDISKSFSAYMFKIAKNKILNYFKDLKSNRSMLEQWVKMASKSTESVEETIIKEEYFECLFNLIEKLPEQKKFIYILSKVNGKTNTEISEITGLSKNTVKNHISESTNILRKLIANF